MSNAGSKQTTREEEIAFLTLESVLGVDIALADAGAGRNMPDGAWTYSDGRSRAIVEITSPPATELMRRWAKAKKAGLPQSEGGSIAIRRGELADFCHELLATDWATENVAKLTAQAADERHLFLFARAHKWEHFFSRLTGHHELGWPDPVGDLTLPEGITDVWFRGGADPLSDDRLGTIKVWLARYQADGGWHRYQVDIEELDLPAPPATIANDRAPADARHPRSRTVDMGTASGSEAT